MRPDLRVRLADLELKNPLVLGSGPLTHSHKNLKRAIEAGFGAIVTKTCTSSGYFRSYPRPEEYLLDYEKKKDDVWHKPDHWSLYLRTGFQHQPPEVWLETLAKVSKFCKENDCVMIGSVEAENDLSSWKKLARMHEDAGCDALELNFCCPHPQVVSDEYTKKTPMGAVVGKNPDLAAQIVREIKRAVRIPVFLKLTPLAEDPSLIALAIKQAGGDGVTCLSRNLALRIDIETGKAIGYTYATSSGPGTKEFSIRWVARIAQEVQMPIMGANGPVKWQDFVEFMMAGANAVQSCSAMMVYGYGYAAEILAGMEAFLARKGYRAQQIVGMALPIGVGADIPKQFKSKYAIIDEEKCIHCRRCLAVCYYGSLNLKGKKVISLRERCVGCLLCKGVCPYDAIEYQERTAENEYLDALRKEV